jgi:sulfur-oxidizing protein SoxZ
MSQTRIVLPKAAKKGETIEIKSLVQHQMETGFRRDNMGRAVPRHIITRYTVTYGGEEIFKVDLFPGVAANPYFAFHTSATETGDIVFRWEDDKGQVITETRRLVVT